MRFQGVEGINDLSVVAAEDYFDLAVAVRGHDQLWPETGC